MQKGKIMSKRAISLLCLVLILAMCFPLLVGCKKQEETSETESKIDTEETINTESGTNDGGETTSDTEPGTEIETEKETLLSGENALIVENADNLKNGVQAYFSDGDRTHVTFENLEMSMEYTLSNDYAQQVTFLKNNKGKTYLENTMDVFVTMQDGKTYFASDSAVSTKWNIYRFGYYFYEMRLEEQVFTGAFEPISEERFKHNKPQSGNQLNFAFKDGELRVENNGDANDPYIIFGRNYRYDTAKYKILEITMKADSNCGGGQIFLIAGSQKGFNSEQSTSFSVKPDGEYHTYRIPLFTVPDYTGTLSGLRVDVNGAGGVYYIKEMKLLEVDVEGTPDGLSINRSFNIYSDKMHQTIQFAATKETTGIKEVGMLTELSADTVAKLIVKDKNGTHETLDGVDWASAEYVGFDIKDAGIFGYILPFDGKGGRIEVTLKDGKYVILQAHTPEGGTIRPSATGTTNANDFFMGQRIYTDNSHDFTEFLHEAYCERNPISSSMISIDDRYSVASEYSGYDSLRGIYKFTIMGNVGGFNTPYYVSPNKHYRFTFDIRGDKYDRKIYVMSYTQSGQLECAVLLDKNDMMLPVPMEVGKNFSEAQGERNLYNIDDPTYSEAIFPMVIKADSKDNTYSLLNLYQLWGKYPLKQISWIQFHAPYYHLSTGVTETNCIVPWYPTKNGKSLSVLPDFRSMSAPFWSDQPQHNSCGTHKWLQYTDAEGNYVASENIKDTIDSYGPTYADVKMDYITDDGKMKISYIHSEMPQLDENRTYYEVKYEILEDISFNNFANDFEFYSVTPNDPTGYYTKLGYLNTENECVVVDAMADESKQYVLGDKCPYFSFFNMANSSSTSQQGYSNVAFLVYNSEFIIGGEKASPNFIITDDGSMDTVSISLNLEKVTLKAGDSFTINCILLPWGSQESDYSGSAPDKNVRDVRENTLLKPLKATADADCTVIESVYIPKVQSTNGVSAEFTLSGGHNNATVRIYGFQKMTVPVIYEKIDGKWVEYVVSSKDTPDQKGNAHFYDGYGIHYDGDGTFSYSFVTTMDNGKARSFKIVADGSYEKWAVEEIAQKEETPLKVYVNAEDFVDNCAVSLERLNAISKYELAEDKSYVRFYGAGPNGLREAYATPFKADLNNITGQYLVLKYRVPKENTSRINHFHFYISTVGDTAVEANKTTNYANIVANGEWQVLVFDLSKDTRAGFADHFVASDDGEYRARFLRIDFFNSIMDTASYIDIAYLGMDSDLDAILQHNADVETVSLVETASTKYISTKTGEEVKPDNGALELPSTFIDPSSGYTRSSLYYAGHFDYINGVASGQTFTYGDQMVVINYSENAVADPAATEDFADKDGAHIVLGGWCVVENGVSKYVWSVDDGKTWHEAAVHGRSDGLGTASQAVLSGATSRIQNKFTFTAKDAANSNFQGASGKNPTGLWIDLSDYAGKTVNLLVATVSAANEKTLCPMVCLSNVKVCE